MLTAKREERDAEAMAQELALQLEAAAAADEPRALAAAVVQVAVKKALAAAEEEDFLKGNAPAALAAKMRHRQAAGFGATPGGADDLKARDGAGPSHPPPPPPAFGFGAGIPGGAPFPMPGGFPPAGAAFPGGVFPGMMGMPGMPPLPPGAALMGPGRMLPGFMAPPPPAWIHERSMPLWLIRQYEEAVSMLCSHAWRPAWLSSAWTRSRRSV
jgi:hypothetical protein